MAVNVVKNLASHADNFKVLRQEHDLMDGLKDLLLSDDSDTALRKEIFGIIEELTDDLNDYEMDELDDLERKAGLAKSKRHPFDDPTFLKEPVSARLHVPGLSDEVFRVRVEQMLIRHSGVISVMFETGAELAVVYTRAQPEVLVGFVSKMTGRTVELQPPEMDDDDDACENADPGATNNSAPGYLDETGQRVKDMKKAAKKKKKTITQGASSLGDRLKQQREEGGRQKARTNRVLDSIGLGFNQGWRLW